MMLTAIHKAVVAILLLAMVGQAVASALMPCQFVIPPSDSDRVYRMPAECHTRSGLTPGDHGPVVAVLGAAADSSHSDGIPDCQQGGYCCSGACSAAMVVGDAGVTFLPNSLSASLNYELQLTQRSDTLFRPPISR